MTKSNDRTEPTERTRSAEPPEPAGGSGASGGNGGTGTTGSTGGAGGTRGNGGMSATGGTGGPGPGGTGPAPASNGGPPGGDPLTVLEAHGFGLTALTDEQREVLRELSSDEVALLVDIKSRLDEVGPEVQAHSEIAGGALF